MSIRDFFSSKSAAPLREAEQALKGWGIAYKRQADGTLLVEGSINISGLNLGKLPDLTRVVVRGDFLCNGNKLTSLQGSPVSVGGDFCCALNLLMSLQGAPATVGGDFWCASNHLATLEGAPETVGGSFSCIGNLLTSLRGAPAKVGWSFTCISNPLLQSLEYAPQKFQKLSSDLGEFSSWDEVPEKLRISPETRERQAAEITAAAAALEKKVRESAGPLRRDIPAPRVIRFKRD